jgi:hypothetical protein
MFSENQLEKIFAIKELQKLDLITQSKIIHAIEEILDEEKENADKFQPDGDFE